MATRERKNFLRAEANKRLQKAMNELANLHGVDSIDVTAKMRDKEMQAIRLTENMASMIETIIAKSASPTKPKARQRAKRTPKG